MASRMSSPWALAVACRTFLPIAHLLLLAPTDLAIAAFRVAIVRVATRIVDAMLVSTWTQDKTHVAVISVRTVLHGYRCGKGGGLLPSPRGSGPTWGVSADVGVTAGVDAYVEAM